MTNPVDAPGEGGNDERSETLRGSYDWSVTSATTATVETVSAALGRDPTSFEPISENVDPDALNKLMQSAAAHGNELSVSFPFVGRRVFLNERGLVVVEPDEIGE